MPVTQSEHVLSRGLGSPRATCSADTGQRLPQVHKERPRHVRRGNERHRTGRGDYNQLYEDYTCSPEYFHLLLSDLTDLVADIPLGMPTIHRKRALSNWGFNCTCELCSAPSEARAASDHRRERLVEIYYAMQDESTDYNMLVELTHEFIKLAQVERLLARVGEYYQSFMRIYYSFGDYETARKYGRTSLMFAEIFSDPEGGFCAGVRRDLGQIDKERREKAA